MTLPPVRALGKTREGGKKTPMRRERNNVYGCVCVYGWRERERTASKEDDIKTRRESERERRVRAEDREIEWQISSRRPSHGGRNSLPLFLRSVILADISRHRLFSLLAVLHSRSLAIHSRRARWTIRRIDLYAGGRKYLTLMKIKSALMRIAIPRNVVSFASLLRVFLQNVYIAINRDISRKEQLSET